MTPEQKQRLEQIEKTPAWVTPKWADMEFLFSLVKEQEAGTRIADDLPYRIVEEMGLGLTFRSCTCGQLPCARLRPLRDALEAIATAMRSACVEVAEQFRELIQYESDEAVRESIFGDMVIKMEGAQAHD